MFWVDEGSSKNPTLLFNLFFLLLTHKSAALLHRLTKVFNSTLTHVNSTSLHALHLLMQLLHTPKIITSPRPLPIKGRRH